MRLLALTVRNYRVHRERAIVLDRSRHLLGGPNESGKSTMAEAAHRALFLKAKTGGAVQAEMVSTLHHGVPEVVLAFEAAGDRWEIEKRFGGPKGTARLTGPGGAVYKDDEAESKLADLLKTEAVGGRGAAGQLPSLWAHLWVWQGDSGVDPGQHAAPFKDDLARRLQQDGVGAAMQSATDQLVRERIAGIYDTLFTATGKPKAGSPAEQARQEWEKAEAAHRSAAEAVSRLEEAIAAHARAERQLKETESALPALRAAKEKVDELLVRVAELRHEEERRLRAWESADAASKQFQEHDSRIRQLIAQLAKSRMSLQPAEAQEQAFVTAEREAQSAAAAAEKKFQEVTEQLRVARLRHDLAAAFVKAFEKFEEHRSLQARLAEATAVGTERAAHRESLAKLPRLSAKDVEMLRKLDREQTQASAALNAMAAAIEVVHADGAVTLDGRPLYPGESRVLTDAGELAVGNGTLIRIRPGGGTSLNEARATADRARNSLAAEFARLGLESLDHAIQLLELRQSLEQKIDHLDTRWKAMGGELLGAQAAAAELAKNAAVAEAERRRAAAGNDIAPPQSLPHATSAFKVAETVLGQATQDETEHRLLEGEARSRLVTATGGVNRHREQLVTARQAMRDLETRVNVLEDSHGDAARRDAALLELRAAQRTVALELAAVRQKLADLSPAQLAADQERYQRALSQEESRRRDAEDLRLSARTRLQLDGSHDPHADLSHAKARMESARAAHESEQRRAQAVASLHQLFVSSREAIDRDLVQPLTERISGYLQCLYGPGASVQVALSESGIAGLELVRPGEPAFAFGTLSGGAREQVAAAVRFAMAEILAADHDGCLPLVFDDAFAYSDPDRIQSLQRMLDLAATRGLQVIVLTCAPADYAAFGAGKVDSLA